MIQEHLVGDTIFIVTQHDYCEARVYEITKYSIISCEIKKKKIEYQVYNDKEKEYDIIEQNKKIRKRKEECQIDINEIFDNEIELLNKRRRKLLNEIS